MVESTRGMVTKINADDAAPSLRERPEVSKSLSLFENGKRVWFSRHRKVGLVIRDNLKEHARIRPALVKLSS